MLAGRLAECAKLDRLLAAARAGRSGSLVMHGDPGVGKTALLEYTITRADACRVVRAVGVEAEMELPFAGLHQLCAQLVGRLEMLPAPQRDALETAFGLSAGAPPERFLVGLAVLGLLSEVAEERPLLCIVDDAQWLDQSSAQALAFVARRLQAESIVLLFATRDGAQEFVGLPELAIRGLEQEAARAFLGSVIPWPLDERVRDLVIAEARGNPLALLELPRGLTPGQLAGGFGLPGAVSLTGRIEESFLRQLEALPSETQRLMLVAAAEPLGDPALLARASALLGVGLEAITPAEAAGLLTRGTTVTFRHPLLRSAIYRAAAPGDRREVHGALGVATDPELDPDRRAWHRAQAASAPDEDVAADLERSAGSAKARGGLAATAAFLERSAWLTLDPARRARRALAAAQAKCEAGAPDAAFDLLAIAEAGPLDELERARAERVRAQLFAQTHRVSEAPPLLLSAARRLQPLDPALARETYLEALWAALTHGRRGALLEVGEALRSASPMQPPSAIELLLTGYAQLLTDGFPAGIDLLKEALNRLRTEHLSGEGETRKLSFACNIAQSLWDDESLHLISTRYVQLTRGAGALSALADALEFLVDSHSHAGEFAAAEAAAEEARAIDEAIDGASGSPRNVLLVALRDDEEGASARIEAILAEATRNGDEGVICYAEYGRAVLNNGLGRYEVAFGAAQRSCDHHPQQGFGYLLAELVEAACRSGKPAIALSALERLSERTRLGGTDWALGVAARSRALLSEGETAEGLYREAIDRLGRTRIRTDLARAHLVFGEWLRRERRRLEAREQLRTAHELLDKMGAKSFAERAARELLATGEKARKRTDDTRAQLTGQETQIAQLARNGLSNPEIGARLFISSRTVEYHLHKVFGKLAITSRNQLEIALPGESREAQPA